jgi:hypothetical protein
MRFLDFCLSKNLDPFCPSSKRVHNEHKRELHRSRNRAKKALAANPRAAWLRRLRQLNATFERLEGPAKRYRNDLETLRIKGRTLDPRNEAYCQELEAQVAEAQRALDAHGAEHPELFAEFNRRLELRDLQRELETVARLRNGALVTAQMQPPAIPPPPALLANHAAAAALARHRMQVAEAEAEQEEAIYHATYPNMLPEQRRAAENSLYAAGEKARKLRGQWERADAVATRAQRHYDERIAKRTAIVASIKEAATMAEAHADALTRLYARIHELRASLPEPPLAPLQQTYNRSKPQRTKPPQRPMAGGPGDADAANTDGSNLYDFV